MKIELEKNKIEIMDADPANEPNDKTEQGMPEPTKEPPRFRLRDLRPEKDPMGAGGKRFSKSGSSRFIR